MDELPKEQKDVTGRTFADLAKPYLDATTPPPKRPWGPKMRGALVGLVGLAVVAYGLANWGKQVKDLFSCAGSPEPTRTFQPATRPLVASVPSPTEEVGRPPQPSTRPAPTLIYVEGAVEDGGPSAGSVSVFGNVPLDARDVSLKAGGVNRGKGKPAAGGGSVTIGELHVRP